MRGSMDSPSASAPTQERSLSGKGPSRAVVRLAGPLALAAVVGVAVFLALTVGIQQLTSTTPDDFSDDDKGYLPSFVHDPPRTVKTTDEYGPPGPVSMVFAGDVVDSGLTGTLGQPWIAVSSLTGDYRALVAPHLPEPHADAMAASPDGRLLAWAHEDGLVLYDAVRDDARELPLGAGAPVHIGQFSPDSRRITAYGGGVLYVVGVQDGDVLGELPDVDDRSARQAVWTPDSTGLTYVADGRLVTRPWRGGPAEHAPTGIERAATLDWHPSGGRIAAVQTAGTGNEIRLFDVRADGSLEPAGALSREAYSMQRMLGFSSETTVSAIGLGLGTGPLPQLYRMSTESPIATDVTQFPAEDRVLATLEVAAGPLQNGSSSFPEPDWPIRDLSKLVISVVAAVFVAGMAFTRRPRQQRRQGGH